VKRRTISSDSPYEPRVGYSRAMRAGDFVFVSGTVAVGSDAYEQAKAAIAKIERALHDAGASLRDVVRTRIFVTNIADWELVARAHRERFGDVRPACSMVEVAKLITPEYVVEIEADACVGNPA
jgi:enamine deaminase RidA (YjgF/YER057c/UK114 family)